MCKLIKEVRDERGGTSIKLTHPLRFKLVKEVRDKRGGTSINIAHPLRLRVERDDTSLSRLLKLVKEVMVDRGNTSINCSHPTKCKVSKATRLVVTRLPAYAHYNDSYHCNRDVRHSTRSVTTKATHQ